MPEKEKIKKFKAMIKYEIMKNILNCFIAPPP
jgi:hypothetical protein